MAFFTSGAIYSNQETKTETGQDTVKTVQTVKDIKQRKDTNIKTGKTTVQTVTKNSTKETEIEIKKQKQR